jgi:hypothetical protein
MRYPKNGTGSKPHLQHGLKLFFIGLRLGQLTIHLQNIYRKNLTFRLNDYNTYNSNWFKAVGLDSREQSRCLDMSRLTLKWSRLRCEIETMSKFKNNRDIKAQFC